MQLLIEEVFRSVFNARNDSFRTSNKHDEVFHVYMTVEFYRDCIREIKGAVSASVMEFHRDNKVMGCPVFLVVESIGGERHAPWRVVKVSGLTSGQSSEEIARLRAELEAAKGEAEALRVDAERYRWLRDDSWSGARIGDASPKVFTLDGAGNRRLVLAEDALDAAIDAARGGK